MMMGFKEMLIRAKRGEKRRDFSLKTVAGTLWEYMGD